MRIHVVGCSLLFFCLSLLVRGQGDSLSQNLVQSGNPDKAYFIGYLSDSRDMVISPFRWNTKQWIGATAVVGATVFLLTRDGAIQEWVQRGRSPALDDISRYVFEPVGSGWYSLSALGILYGCGWIWKDQRAKVTALKGVEAFVLSGITVQVLKHLTHRHRPDQDIPLNPGLWEGPFQGFSCTSFPSGHAATAFSIATVIATAYQETVWVPVLCYTLATGAALSRVYDNKHWASDVLIGSVIGFGIGKLVMNNSKKIKILPVSATGIGLSLIYPL